MNLIALMNSPAPLAPAYLVEAGNRLAQPQEGSPPGAGRVEPKPVAAPASESALKELVKESSGPVDRTVPPTAGPVSAGARSPEDREPAKVVVRDAGQAAKGNLGIVIVRSSAQEPAIEAGDFLSGQPVYTVYLDVPGAPRKWVLYYCTPAGSSPSFVREGESVIRILPKKSVDPPFPLEKIPVDLAGYHGQASRLMVYAIVNERGETENVRLVRGTGQEIDARAVAILKKWTFRPAKRGDSPVAVEALFGIPLN